MDAADYDPVDLQVGDLRVGMFVCGLDRPWEETPFPPYGFEIKSAAQLEGIKLYCQQVSVDLARTQLVHVRLEEGQGHADGRPNLFARARQQSSAQEDELAVAQAVGHETASLVNSMADALRYGTGLDLPLSQYAVSECVASILRNPDVIPLMLRLQQSNPQFSNHALHVCIHSIVLGRRHGLRAKQLEELGLCGLLHDVGILRIAAGISNKAGALDAEELALVKTHTVRGHDMLAAMEGLPRCVAEVAHNHHECLDGTGYPRGLTGRDIGLNTRIVALVDKYVAITQNSVYKSAQSHLDAVNLLKMLADRRKIDEGLCDSFMAGLGIYPPGTVVGLSSNEVAIVLKSNAKQRLRPQLLVVRDADGGPVERRVDLASTPHDGKGRDYKIKRVYLPGQLDIDLPRYQRMVMEAYDD